jgi:NADH-quinone oxidoreductase subunit C
MNPPLDELLFRLNDFLPPVPAAAVAAKAAPAANATGAGSEPAEAPPVEPAPLMMPAAVAVNHTERGIHAEVTAPSSQLEAVAATLDRLGFGMDTITGVDWIAEEQMEVVYDFFHPISGMRVAMRARAPRSDPEFPSIQAIFPGANWHERETHDFFGIRFAGHPDLSPLLLVEDATFHPLRKDFAGASE